MSACDGDEPGLQMNPSARSRAWAHATRHRQRQRPPGSLPQPGDAARLHGEWGQNPAMVTSFADGSKISFEQTIIANATGSKVLKRGMSRGVRFDGSPPGAPIAVRHRPDQGNSAASSTTPSGRSSVKVFVPGRAFRPQAEALPEPIQAGRRAAYPFWIPYHLPHIETPNAIARVALFSDGTRETTRRPQRGSVRCGEA